MSTRFLADENFPFPTVKALRDVGHDVICVGEIAGGIDDSQVLDMARREDRVLLTCDKDFGTLAFHSHEDATCGIVLARVQTTNLSQFTRRVVAAIATRNDWRGSFTVITRTGIRRRRYPAG
jgi:predicted nuclease of predicted toxin-antitoxin system